MEEYLHRVVDDALDFYLDTFGAVLLRGPKWCGKTTTAEVAPLVLFTWMILVNLGNI